MSQKQRVLVAFVALSLLLLCATLLWADSEPTGVKCLPEQPSNDNPARDDFTPKAGVLRNRVLLEIGTGTW